MPGFDRRETAAVGKYSLRLLNIEQRPVIKPRAGVFKRGRRLQEGLKVRLFQPGHVQIRRLPNRDREWIIGVVKEVLNDRDVLVLVTLDLLDQLRIQPRQYFRNFPPLPSSK